MTRRVHHEPRRTLTLTPDTGPVELPEPVNARRTLTLHVAVLAPGVIAVGMLAGYLMNGAP